ncbi:MAG: GNAT family N-acetyltransferase [Syntrophobacteraceae bacterium]
MQTLRIESLSEASSIEGFLARFVGLGRTLRAEPWNRSALSREKEAAILNAFPGVPHDLWISSEDSEPVGRISASFPLVASLPARVGFFEVDVRHRRWKEHAAQLFREAHQWLAGRGQFEVVGPMDFTTWFPYRLKTNGMSTEQKHWEPGNPPEYMTAFEDAGYTVIGKYVSLCHEDLKEIAEENRHVGESFRTAGFRVRTGDLTNPAEVARLHSMTLTAFRRNPFFEPIPLEIFTEVYAEVHSKGSAPQFFGILENASGNVLGYVYGFVDGREVVAKTMAFLPEVQGKGLGLFLYEAVADFGLKHGCTRCVAALMSEEIGSRRLDEKYTTTHPMAWVHEYALYGRNVSDCARASTSLLESCRAGSGAES